MRPRQTTMLGAVAAIGLLAGKRAAAGQPAFSCAGFAQLGGAQLLCSHTDPAAPPQVCTFSWSLAVAGGSPTVVQGSFLLTPGLTNATMYQGNGFAYALGSPVVLCQARRTPP